MATVSFFDRLKAQAAAAQKVAAEKAAAEKAAAEKAAAEKLAAEKAAAAQKVAAKPEAGIQLKAQTASAPQPDTRPTAPSGQNMPTNPILAGLKTFGTTSGTLKEKVTAAQQAGAAAQPAHAASVAEKKDVIDTLQQQILGQNMTGKWSGEGHGSAEANARDMAKILAGIGITDIRQFGEIKTTVPGGGPIYSEPTVIGYSNDESSQPIYSQSEIIGYEPDQVVTKFGNKVTGQVVPTTYSERQTGNAWGGTFAGDGNTGYRVQFAPDGTPIFYTTGASSSDLGSIAPLLSLASIIPSPLQPFAAAANAAIAIDQGNVLGGLAALSGIPGISAAANAAGLGAVVSGLQTANKLNNFVNAAESGNILGALTSGASLAGVGGATIGDTGYTVNDALKAANVIKAADNGNFMPLIKSFADPKTVDAPKAKDFEPDSMSTVEGAFDPNKSGYLGTADEIKQDNTSPLSTLNIPNEPNPEVFETGNTGLPEIAPAPISAGDVGSVAETKQDDISPLSTLNVVNEPAPTVLETRNTVAPEPVPEPEQVVNFEPTPEVEKNYESPLSTLNIPDEPKPTVLEAVNTVAPEAVPEPSPVVDLEPIPEIEKSDESPLSTLAPSDFVAPDYSLFPPSSTPNLPDMGAGQGIEAPSLPSVFPEDSGVNYDLYAPTETGGEPEFVMPSTPGVEDMGGGLGLTLPVESGTIAESGLVPESYTPPLGDENSFINQPIIQEEFVEPPPSTPSFVADYSLFPKSETTYSEEMGGAQGIQAPDLPEVFNEDDEINYDLYAPTPNEGEPTLEMPTSPNLDPMGGGQGLTLPVDGGTITESGFIPDEYVAPLGDPDSFINQPAPGEDVSSVVNNAVSTTTGGSPSGSAPSGSSPSGGLPSASTPSASTPPKVTPSANPAQRYTPQTPRIDTGIPWLDTKDQILAPVLGSGSSQKPTGSKLAELRQLYEQLDPELASVFADRGVIPPQQDFELGMASGGSAFPTDVNFRCETAKAFVPCTSDFLVGSTAKRRTPLELAKLKHINQNISSMGNINGLAKGGLPQKYRDAEPDGHNTEFVTGLTGFYACGRGTGQSDCIPAILHDGDYVMDAEAVSALGDGSSKAGREVLEKFHQQIPHHASTGGKVVPAKIADGEYVFPAGFVTALGGGDNKRGADILDGLREKLRNHKRSAPTSKIPPKAKSPLDYLKMAKG